MCGIIAIVRRRTDRESPSAERLSAELGRARQALPSGSEPDLADRLGVTSDIVAGVDRELRGEGGLSTLLADPGLVVTAAEAVGHLHTRIEAIEARLETMG
jgi:hypothetical protein